MPVERAKSPPKAMADAEQDVAAALEFLLKCAVAVGAKEPGAVVRAKSARQSYQTAIEELRRSERARGRTGSITWIQAQLGITARSANVRDVATSIDWPAALREALEALAKALW